MRAKRSLVIYTLSHFYVDFACFLLLFGLLEASYGGERLFIAFLLYNVLAFGLQPIFGYFCPPGFEAAFGAGGCLLVGLGLAFSAVPAAALLLCAVGNALFHTGGGVDSLARAGGRCARSGVFVSAGALGVLAGTLAGQRLFYLPLPFAGGAAVCAVAIALLCRRGPEGEKAPAVSAAPGEAFAYLRRGLFPAALALPLLLLSVAIRAWAGLAAPVTWTGESLPLRMLPALCAFAGKFAGGFLADRFGARRVSVTALLCSVAPLCLWADIPAVYAAGVFLFNLTMPVTVCAAYAHIPASPGAAFGSTTLALLCGTVVTYFYALPASAAVPVLAAAVIVSAVCLLLALPRGGRRVSK